MTHNWIEVEMQMDTAGMVRPLSFRYRGQRIRVVSYGRQWETDGGWHYLVMDRQNRVYELAYDRVEDRWALIQSPDDYGPQSRQAT